VTSLRWTVLLPVKALPSAKSRLASTLPEDWRDLHPALVEAMRTDVLSAARTAPQVAHVLVIADVPGEYDADAVIVQRSAGLNGALRDGAAYAREHWPEDGVAALVGDLPALTPTALEAALDAAAAHPSSFVRDADGSGTTLLAARAGERLNPRFGEGSAARHGAAAVEISSAPAAVRRDVDTAADLAEAVRLGAGAATARVWAVMPRSP